MEPDGPASFPPASTGSGPQGELTFDKDGNVYGTTYGGGRYNAGTVFRATRAGKVTVLRHLRGIYEFAQPPDGANPPGRLVFARDGSLIGTTVFGGDSDRGTIFRLVPKSNGTWIYSIVHHFVDNATNGTYPHTGLTMDGAGSLYGTAAGGGPKAGGILYKLAKVGGAWKFSLVYGFQARGALGDDPQSQPVIQRGKLYGTTLVGGKVTNGLVCRDGCGVVYEIDR